MILQSELAEFICPQCHRQGFFYEKPNQFHPNTRLLYCRFTDCVGFSVEGKTDIEAMAKLRGAIQDTDKDSIGTNLVKT